MADYICKVVYARDITNSFSRRSAMPLPPCLRNCSIFFAQRTNTNKHSTTGKQRHFRVVKKNIVLSLNFVTKNSEQTVIQGLASDKVYCTHNNRPHRSLKFSGRVCLKMLVLRTPCFGVSYPQGVRVPPVKNHCCSGFRCSPTALLGPEATSSKQIQYSRGGQSFQ